MLSWLRTWNTGFADNTRKAVREKTLSIVKRASQQTLQAVPGRVSQFQNDGT